MYHGFLKFLLYTAINLLVIKNWAQPYLPPRAFQDDYVGKINFNMKAAKVKKEKIYFRFDKTQNTNKLYIFREYNRNGYIVNQKYYSLKSGKEMYSAHYEYDKDNYFLSVIEKITPEYDNFEWYSRKLDIAGMPMNNTAENPLGDSIPVDKNGDVMVKTKYIRDTLDGYLTRKYFFDDTFYQELICYYGIYGPNHDVKLFLNKNKLVELDYSNSFYKTDTIFRSLDSLELSIKYRNKDLEYCKVLKRKIDNEFQITDIELSPVIMKLRFSYENAGVLDDGIRINRLKSIIYYNDKSISEEPLLIHKINYSDTIGSKLMNKIPLELELRLGTDFDIQTIKRHLTDKDGCIYYTRLSNGALRQEVHYALENDVQKMRDIYYTGRNLVLKVVYYPTCYNLGPFSTSFDSHQKSNVEEYHEYEYFD